LFNLKKDKMRKIVLFLACMIAVISYAQLVEFKEPIYFTDEVTGESVTWSEPANNQSRIIAKCRCYQGTNRDYYYQIYKSCCWVHPNSAGYPYCSDGCI
jgi:hypothetical protein